MKKFLNTGFVNFCFYLSPIITEAQTEIRYLGNMGIAIIRQDSAIIIDGLHDYYEKNYLQTDTTAFNTMLLKQKPFSKIIAIAVTHKHSDHFDEMLISEVAKKHSTALILGGSQIRSLCNAAMLKRFTTIVDTATVRINSNIIIRIRRIPHTWPQRHATIENYRYEITWNKFRLVHLGDADTQQEAVIDLQQAPDVLVAPNWYLGDNGVSLINKVNPGNIVVTHIPPDDKSTKANTKIKGQQLLFKKYGDTFKINKP